MAKLIPMQEAAQILGLSVEELNDLRSRNEIFGYRDGSSWKFKEEEIQRVAAVRATKLRSDEERVEEPVEEASDELLGIDGDLAQLVDVSETEPSGSGGNADADNELLLAAESVLDDAEDDEKSSTVIGADDELSLDEDLQLASSDSDVLDLEDNDAASPNSDLGGDDELRLASDEDFELNIAESASAEDEEDFKLSDSELDLGSESDIDLVLDHDALTESSSEVVLASEEDAPAAASADDLELSADDLVTLGDEPVESEDTAHLKADDDFLLTPVDGGSAVDESDSGSQVIDLDEDFEGADQGMFVEDAGEQVLGVEEDPDLATFPEEGASGLEAAASGGPGLARVADQAAEEYSVWNVLGLTLIVLVFLPTSIMMIDLMRNMWSWDGTNSLNSSLMDTILSMFGA